MVEQWQGEGLSFFQLALTLAKQRHSVLLDSSEKATDSQLSQRDETMFENVATQSLADQATIESEPQLDFETFLAQWNAA